MIKDFLISFKDNIKKKTSNPFLGTYAIVWIVRNWELIYSLFNFDSNINRIKKIEIIKTYYSDKSFIHDLLINILWAFGVLILTFALVNLSRLIVNLYEKRLTPYIYKVTDSKSIVLKEIYNQLESEKEILEGKLEKERESKNKLQIEIASLEEKMDKLSLENFSHGNLTLTDEEIKEFDLKSIDSDKEGEILFKKIKSKNLSNDFLNICSLIESSSNDIIEINDLNKYNSEYFIKLGLISKKTYSTSSKRVAITEIGEKVLRFVRLNL